MNKLLTAIFLASVVLFAHHSTETIFDVSKRIAVSGTLTNVEWINPHIFFHLEAKGQAWKMETSPPSWFKSVKVERSAFEKAIGQQITVEANPARNGTNYGYMLKITFPDKIVLEIADPNREE